MLQTPPPEFGQIGLHGQFKKYGNDEWHGPCPFCGGRDRFIIYTDRDFPSWNWWCRQCTPDGGWVDEINPRLKQEMMPEEINRRRLENLERRMEEIERRQKQQEQAIEELRSEQAWVKYYDNMITSHRRQAWRNRGIPDQYQDLWMLGYCEDFSIRTGYNEYFKTPTLSIPVWGYKKELNNIKHRLLNPPNAGGKYRQEKTGVPAAPFISHPDIDTGPLFLAEGEIKAMVTFVTLDDDNFQVAGLPSANPNEDLLSVFGEHEPVYLCLDPDVDPTKAKDMLGAERVRTIRLPMKIDDAILAGALDKNGLKRIMRMAT